MTHLVLTTMSFVFLGGCTQDDNNDDDSSSRYEKDNSSEVPTIELSNDSNTSSGERKPGTGDETPTAEHQRKPRIYLKQDLVKPENLKPEMLVRFRDVLPMDHNGMNESAPSSASENDTAQDWHQPEMLVPIVSGRFLYWNKKIYIRSRLNAIPFRMVVSDKSSIWRCLLIQLFIFIRFFYSVVSFDKHQSSELYI